MKKIFLFVVLILSATTILSQKNQRVAYIDMEYILENIPQYLEAQNALNSKVSKWQKKLDTRAREIEVLKTDLANEKAILTKDLIEEKEEEITIKQEELRKLESLYFGPNGDMFMVRKQLVKPIQDQVYNAVQNIAKRKKYDFVFDKSSDLVMLYSNKKHDISDLVLATIIRTQKIDDLNAKKEAKKNASSKKELNPKQKEIIAKKEAALAKKISDREAKKQAIIDKRKALLKQREEKRKLLREKKEALKKKKEQEKKDKNNN